MRCPQSGTAHVVKISIASLKPAKQFRGRWKKVEAQGREGGGARSDEDVLRRRRRAQTRPRRDEP